MQLGDTITLAGQEWTARAFSPAEHQRFDEIAAPLDLPKRTAEFEVMANTTDGTARIRFLQADMKRVQDKLDAYLNEGEVKPDLTDGQRLEGYALAAELDELEARLQAVRGDHNQRMLIMEDDLTEAREQVVTEFMHEVLGRTDTLAEFRAALTEDDFVTLDDLVVLGKLRTGLSALRRRQSAAMQRIMALTFEPGSGNASEFSPQQPESPAGDGAESPSDKPS